MATGEETLPKYRAEAYFPARPGQTLQNRYRIVGKLGFGISSTVWLSWDDSSNRYVALKIYKRGNKEGVNEVNRELDIYRHINAVSTNHPGAEGIRTLLDSFQIRGPTGDHWCLVHPPLWDSCESIQKGSGHPKLPKDFLRDVLKSLLGALDYLHTECHVIHADIKSDNIMMSVADQAIFAAFEEAEKRESAQFKLNGDRRIYCSRGLETPDYFDLPILTDFGNSHIDRGQNVDNVQPWQYRAPEVILRMPWSYEIDIWNVGVLIWNLFENKTMFTGIDPRTGDRINQAHLAEMIGYLGPPPLYFLQRSDCYSNWFEDVGVIGEFPEEYKIPLLSLRRAEENLIGRDKDLFLQFLGKMLKWVPEERATAAELLEDPWLNGEPADADWPPEFGR